MATATTAIPHRPGILRRTSSPSRPSPRFLLHSDAQTTRSRAGAEPSLPWRSPANSYNKHHRPLPGELYTIPAIMAYLTKVYSEEQVSRVPPVFMPSCTGGNATLGEPYEVTLKKAVERDGEIVLVKRRKPKKKPSEDDDEQSQKSRRRSPPRVTFADDA